MNSLQTGDGIHHLMNAHKYKDAEEAINRLLDEQGYDHRLFVSLARCQLALEKFDEALHNYTHLLQHSEDVDIITGIEAALVLAKPNEAFRLCQIGRNQYENDPEFHFLFALAAYKQGHIKVAANQLDLCVRLDFEWDDEDPIDFVAQQVLPTREFHDFEQLYFDARERVSENAGEGQNRWFFLNMAVWDLFKASDPIQQRKRALALADLLSPHFDETFLSNGKSELWRIVNDFNDNESLGAFLENARTSIRENEFSRIAGLILALQFDHLKQFAAFFDLSENEIQESRLQDLLGMLPFRLAVGLLFLYSASQTQKEMPDYNPTKLPDDIFAGLIAAGFVSFYQQIDRYRPKGAQENRSGSLAI